RDVAEAVIASAIRVRASELYAGESATVSADAQARRLGDAWDRAQAADATLRVVIFRRSGRRDIYHLGPHAPELQVRDLDFINPIWSDGGGSAGPLFSLPNSYG